VLFYAATIGFTVVPGSPRARKAGLAAFGALLLTSAGFTAARWLERGVAVSFLPVGQGDAALVELPGGATMLVDTGPAFGRGDAAARVIVPYLRARRITRLDRVVLTHPHADHTGGLATLAREIPIDRVWWTGDRREAPTAVLAPLDGLEVEVVEPGSRWMVGAASVEVLGPVGGPGAPIVNDGSVVLAVRIGRRTILLSGDAEAEAERRLVETHGERLRADVLKAGHHGSRTSSTDPFLAAARPAHVVLSLGRGNLFGFPHAEALARIRNAGAEIWRTDLDGLVRVETDGEELRIRGHARSPTAGGRL